MSARRAADPRGALTNAEPFVSGTPYRGRRAVSATCRWYYHNAGAGGQGGSVYIDATIRRDRNAVPAASGPETLEEALYYLQNWRGDVVCTVQADGRIAEQVRYSAYGRPYVVSTADHNGTGGTELLDIFDYQTDWFGANPEYTDYLMDGSTSDLLDLFAFLTDWFVYTGAAGGRDRITQGAGATGAPWESRRGYAGYEHDSVDPDLQLSRNRFYRADFGIWSSRDPLGYGGGGHNLIEYSLDQPLTFIDPSGLTPRLTCFRCTENVTPDDQQNWYYRCLLWDPDSDTFEWLEFNKPPKTTNPPYLVPTPGNPKPRKDPKFPSITPGDPFGPNGPLPPGPYRIIPSGSPSDFDPNWDPHGPRPKKDLRPGAPTGITPSVTSPGRKPGVIDSPKPDGTPRLRTLVRCHGRGRSDGCMTCPLGHDNPFWELWTRLIDRGLKPDIPLYIDEADRDCTQPGTPAMY